MPKNQDLLTLVVKSILLNSIDKKRRSAPKARTVTIPSNVSANPANMGLRVVLCILLMSRPALIYPFEIRAYKYEIMLAGTRNSGKT